MYELKFVIASLAIICVVMVHFYWSQRPNSQIRSIGLITFLSAVCFLDVAFDLITALMIERAAEVPLWLLYVANTVFFLLQISMIFILFQYISLMCGSAMRRNLLRVVVSSVPYGLMFMMIVLNPVTHTLFVFDSVTHAYSHSFFYLSMYVVTFIYLFAALVYAIVNRSSMRRIDYICMWEYVLVTLACVLVQFIFPDILFTSFGVALGYTVLMLTATNQAESVNSITQLPEGSSFRRTVASMIKRGERFDIVYVSLTKLRVSAFTYGQDHADGACRSCSIIIKNIAQAHRVFHLQRWCFAVICTSHREQRRVALSLAEALDRRIQCTCGHAYIEVGARVGCVCDAHELGTAQELESFMDYLSLEAPVDSPVLLVEGDRKAEFARYLIVKAYLEKAVRDDLFEVYLQPIYSIEKSAFDGAEALSRLRHPELGFIPPDEFIPIAEREGLISDIGRLQMRRICKFAKENKQALAEAGIEELKVNISQAEFSQAKLARRYLEIIHEFELDPSMFCFEITETAASHVEGALLRLMDAFAAEGASVYLDDFGKGYANFDMVMRYPFSGVKIDISLLRQMEHDVKAAKLYANIVSLMSSFGLRVVSEGVETPNQARVLRTWGVDALQGYLCARPMPAESLLPFLREEGDGYEW